MANDQVQSRLMLPGEAEKLQALLTRCYGDSYFDGLYYDAQALAHSIASARQYSMVAVNSAGEFVSHIGVRNFARSLTADTTMAIVDPRYRSRGLFVDIGTQMLPVYEKLGLRGLYLQSVTIHPYTQLSTAKGHAGIVGLYLNYIPAATQFLAMDSFTSSVPTPSLIQLQELAVMPGREVVIPKRYREQVQAAFAQCNMPRSEVSSEGQLAQSQIRVEQKPRQRVAYLWVERVGEDFSMRLDAILADGGYQWVEYDGVYLQLAMSGQAVDGAIGCANELGFAYAGVLPEYGKRDWLTLQRVDFEVLDVSEVFLVSDYSKEMLDFILQDMQRVG